MADPSQVPTDLSADLSAEASAKVEASAKEGPLPTSPTFPSRIANRIKANQARIQKKITHLQKILDLTKTKVKINNQDIRNLLRSSQSTVTGYLKELASSGKLKIEGKAKATYYSLT